MRSKDNTITIDFFYLSSSSGKLVLKREKDSSCELIIKNPGREASEEVITLGQVLQVVHKDSFLRLASKGDEETSDIIWSIPSSGKFNKNWIISTVGPSPNVNLFEKIKKK